ncbi:hypothetical protein HYT05_02100 [Candidatus Kaiserbacteria bacterium]|nr:hypothetical protein [Candidatus Kaiserbacteria bacterium]
MVLKRTIGALRSRPHDERHAFAVLSALVVMVILLLAWGVFFFSSIQSDARDQLPNIGTKTAPAQGASAAAAISDIVRSTVTSDIGAQVPGEISTDVSGGITGQVQTPTSYPSQSTDGNDVAAQLQAALNP